MRIAFIGTNSLTLAAAELLLEDGHEVVIIERSRERIEDLAERLDAGFIHGDGTSPDVLRDAEPENTAVLFCLLESDQTNILAGLIGRSLGFERVVPRVNNPQFQHIAIELGLNDSVMPNRAVARHLKELIKGQEPLELSLVIRGDAVVFAFVATEEEAGPVAELSLPAQTRIVCIYREDDLLLPDDGPKLKPGDEVILITHRTRIDQLRERWGNGGGAT
ncbi:potassium channel family protein [Thiococcus pfennigii]|uniref:potassium channel family protein n=1 Tax=Thiococcus pfennigii TaxID=1057 RepID=UPI0019066A55|nr:NAD-binding protein [Thiococcus pfennigii]MBK1733267.1 potassium transporter [Thiococcus pfennigii]